MAGQNRRGRDRKSSSTAEKSLFSMINIFKLSPSSKRSQDYEEAPRPEPARSRRTWFSDEDRVLYVGEPDVDKKATDYITRFYEARMTERKTVVL